MTATLWFLAGLFLGCAIGALWMFCQHAQAFDEYQIDKHIGELDEYILSQRR